MEEMDSAESEITKQMTEEVVRLLRLEWELADTPSFSALVVESPDDDENRRTIKIAHESHELCVAEVETSLFDCGPEWPLVFIGLRIRMPGSNGTTTYKQTPLTDFESTAKKLVASIYGVLERAYINADL